MISRRKFIHSIGTTVALSSIAAFSIISLLSCEKEKLGEENSDDSDSAICLAGNYCEEGYEYSCTLTCGDSVSYNGGSGS